MKNGSSSAPKGAGSSSLAITERQKPAPSCVAALFQMLAKRKLFSSSSKKSKLLPPVRAQKFSPGRSPGGGEKTPVAKMRPLLLDSADYARSKSQGQGTNRLPPPSQDNNCSEIRKPDVVARLMGLSSMPAASHQRSASAIDFSDVADLGGHQNECFQDMHGSGSAVTSHQKQQKPGRGGANQFSTDAHALWSQRHPYKVASPLKSPRSISSRNKARLIEAAARVLDPGVQSRNRHRARRHGRLEYSSNGNGVGSNAAVLQILPDQSSRDMCVADSPISGARDIRATCLHNSSSSQWSEENGKRNAIRRPNQNVPSQEQAEGNSKALAASSSEKARFKESVQKISNATTDKYQDVRKIQPRSISQGNVNSSPLKQNNLKQNALPVACRAEDPGQMTQRHKHRIRQQNVANTATDYVYLHKCANSSTSLRSKEKGKDITSITGETKNLSTKGHRTYGIPGDSSKKLKIRNGSPKAMEKDMIIAKGAGLVTEKPKSISRNCARNDSQRQVEVELRSASRCNNSDIVSFTFSSPVKDAPTLHGDHTRGTNGAVLGSSYGNSPKRHSRRDRQNISSQGEVSQHTSSLGAAELVSFNGDELRNRDIPGGRVTSSMTENTIALPTNTMEKSSSDEFRWQYHYLGSQIYGFGELTNPAVLSETHKIHEAKEKASNAFPSIPRGSRQREILQSAFVDGYCISGSPNYTADAEFEDRYPSETCAPPFSRQDVTTKSVAEPNFRQHGLLHPSEAAVKGSELTKHGEVTATAELLLTDVCPSAQQKPKADLKTSLFETFESCLDSSMVSPKSRATEASRKLAFDFVVEYMDSVRVRLCDSGYRSFLTAGAICTRERLSAEVRKKIARCIAMAGTYLDEIAAGDVEHAIELGMNSLQEEALDIAARIERDLVQEMVDEIRVDMLRQL